MNRGAWWAAVSGVAKELGITEQLTLLLFTWRYNYRMGSYSFNMQVLKP